MSTSVIGAGPWGATVAWLIGKEGREVSLWSSSETKRAVLRDTRKPPRTEIDLPDTVTIVDTLEEALAADLVFLAVPPAYARAVARAAAPFVRPDHRIVHTVKGLEPGGPDGGHAISTVISEETCCLMTGMLAGPVAPAELWRGDEMAAVVGSRFETVAIEASQVLNGPSLRVYQSLDLTGVEIGGAMRTPIGLAAGMLREAGLGGPTRAFLLTRGLAEAGRLADALGGQHETVAGLSGIGDWLVTSEDEDDPVMQAGHRLARGETGGAPRSEARVRTLLALAKRKGVDLPITEAVGAVLDGTPMQEALAGLMSREIRFEG